MRCEPCLSRSVTVALLFLGFNLWLVLAGSFALGAFSAVFQPAERAMIPAILEKDQLADANGLIQLTSSLAQALSNALGGALVVIVGADPSHRPQFGDLSRLGTPHRHAHHAQALSGGGGRRESSAGEGEGGFLRGHARGDEISGAQQRSAVAHRLSGDLKPLLRDDAALHPHLHNADAARRRNYLRNLPRLLLAGRSPRLAPGREDRRCEAGRPRWTSDGCPHRDSSSWPSS